MSDNPPPYLTVKQAALRAGVSGSLVYAWCGDGTLSDLRVGRRAGSRGKILIAPADLDAVMASFRAGPPPSASAPASSGSPVGPFSELDRDRLARAWRTRRSPG